MHLSDCAGSARRAAAPLRGSPAILAFGAVAWFLYRVFHPRRGVMAQLRHPDAYPMLMGSYWLWYPALVLYPIAMIIMAWSGYLYTASGWKPTTTRTRCSLFLRWCCWRRWRCAGCSWCADASPRRRRWSGTGRPRRPPNPGRGSQRASRGRLEAAFRGAASGPLHTQRRHPRH
jgi:hypothetical protein